MKSFLKHTNNILLKCNIHIENIYSVYSLLSECSIYHINTKDIQTIKTCSLSLQIDELMHENVSIICIY